VRILLFSWSSNAVCLVLCWVAYVSGEVPRIGIVVGGEAMAWMRRTYTWTSFTMTLALGVRGARISENDIKAATTMQTVVKKPKTFCARVMVVCIFVGIFSQLRN
jgi:hypothetical protein